MRTKEFRKTRKTKDNENKFCYYYPKDKGNLESNIIHD